MLCGMDGEELRRRRTALGLTQMELARRLGTSQQTVHKWESGSTRIQHAPMMHLALRYLEVARELAEDLAVLQERERAS